MDWLMDFLWGIGKFFVLPLFYYSLFFSVIMGYFRVKRERRDFKIRAEGGYYELKNLLPRGIIAGIVLSLLAVGAGVVVPMSAIVVTTAVAILLSLTFVYRWLSPSYVIGISIIVLFILQEMNIQIPYFGDEPATDLSLIPALAVLMGLLIMAEGILISKDGAKGTTPRIIKSNRGMIVGAHWSQKLWLVPIFLFVPGDLTSPFDWWPVFHIGEQMTVSPILVPFLIGFSQQMQGRLPEKAVKATGERVFGLGLIITGLAIASVWMPIFTVATALVAILGRESIHRSIMSKEKQMPFIFSKRDKGVLVLGIIPQSPADKMGLKIGEVISKVNGMAVNTERELYEALQKNRAYCKLEVFDEHDEIRFVQRALYEGEHYELGILFVEDKRKQDVAVS
ncbi:MAG: PDZ domain-containing protein [Bacillus sp. (in: firmicutes)]